MCDDIHTRSQYFCLIIYLWSDLDAVETGSALRGPWQLRGDELDTFKELRQAEYPVKDALELVFGQRPKKRPAPGGTSFAASALPNVDVAQAAGAHSLHAIYWTRLPLVFRADLCFYYLI